MKWNVLSALFIVAPMIAAAPARSAPLPPAGSAAYAASFACRQLDMIDMGEAGNQSVAECVGISRSTGESKLFDNMSVRCLEDGEARAGSYKFTGWCAQTDGDGDKLFTSYAGSEGGDVAYIGGTGKYKNISFKGTWTVKDAPAVAPGQFAFVIDYKVDWQAK
jgi:hypothetical protein